MPSALQLLRTTALTMAWLVAMPCLALLLSVLVPVVPWLRIVASATVPKFASWMFLISLCALGVALLAHAARRSRAAAAAIAAAALSMLAAAWIVLNLLYVAQSNGARIDLISALAMHPFDEGTPDARRMYARPGGEDLRLDIYRPRDAASGIPTPVLIVVHGGGFVEGSRTFGAANMRWLADHGWTVISVDYRLARAGRPTWQLATADVECAMVWTRAHAGALGIDLDRVVLTGGSAGASLAMDAAYATNAHRATPSCAGPLPHVAAVIAKAPLVDAVAAWNHPGEMQDEQRFYLARYFGGSPARFPARYAAFDFRRRLLPSNPPTLILGGSQDPLIPPEGAAILAHEASMAGLKIRSIVFPYSGHDFNTRFDSLANQAVLQIIRNYMIEQGAGPIAPPAAQRARRLTPGSRNAAS